LRAVQHQPIDNHARQRSDLNLWDFTYLCWDRPHQAVR
jgi:hypothetical protein